ncbi:MAG: ribose 5-phosphate isomerase A [Nitrososphaeria archaeon]
MSSIAKDLAEEIISSRNVGIGSGRTISDFVDALSSLRLRRGLTFIPSSHQTLLNLQDRGLNVNAFPISDNVGIYIDGVDQIEMHNYYMIKGGGGALAKEKVLMYNSNKVALLVQEKKIVEKLGSECPIPVEVIPFARLFIMNFARKIGGEPKIRRDARNFPVFTENGNLIVDIMFREIPAPVELERKLKDQPGVLEVGIFTKRPYRIYVIKEGSFQKLSMD